MPDYIEPEPDRIFREKIEKEKAARVRDSRRGSSIFLIWGSIAIITIWIFIIKWLGRLNRGYKEFYKRYSIIIRAIQLWILLVGCYLIYQLFT